MSFIDAVTENEKNHIWNLIVDISTGENLSIYKLLCDYLNKRNKRNNNRSLTTSSNSNLNYYFHSPLICLQEIFNVISLSTFIKENELTFQSKLASLDNESFAYFFSCYFLRESSNGNEKEISKNKKGRPIVKQTSIERLQEEKKVLSVRNDLRQIDQETVFKSKCIELICFFYFYQCIRAKNNDVYTDYLFSFRDSLDYFTSSFMEESTLPILQLLEILFEILSKKINATYFLQYSHKYLISNHFKLNYQRSIKAYPEQLEFIDNLIENEDSLFILPWGTGVGKTALLPVISQYFMNIKKIFYCVFAGPVRDQNAAYLYRCGIPFALVTKYSLGKKEKWDLQPSYHCNNNVFPQVFIVEPEFMAYYLQFMNSSLLNEDVNVYSLDILVPDYKPRYLHLRRRNELFPKDPNLFGIIIDEPDDTNIFLDYIFSNITPSSFIMSATDTNLFNEYHQEQFKIKFSSKIINLSSSTIGISTTLRTGSDYRILSPFHCINSHQEFILRIHYVKNNILLQRFLSPHVFHYFIFEIIAKLHRDQRKLFCEILILDYRTISFTEIAHKVLLVCERLSEIKVSDDFYKNTFCYNDSSMEKSQFELIENIIIYRSRDYLHGCIIATNNVNEFYHLLENIFEKHRFKEISIDALQKMVKENEQECRNKLLSICKHKYTQELQLEYDEMKLNITKNIIQCLPIDPGEIINTKSYINLKNKEEKLINNSSKNVRYNDIIPLYHNGDFLEDPLNWSVALPITQNIPDYVNIMKFRGIACLDYSRENCLKTIFDSDLRRVAFILSDKNTAYGLNVKISHAILADIDPDTFLPKNAYFQIAGRVGRNNQQEIGDVYILSSALFQYLMS